MCDFSDLNSPFRDSSIRDLEIQPETALRRVLRLWKAPNMVSILSGLPHATCFIISMAFLINVLSSHCGNVDNISF